MDKNTISRNCPFNLQCRKDCLSICPFLRAIGLKFVQVVMIENFFALSISNPSFCFFTFVHLFRRSLVFFTVSRPICKPVRSSINIFAHLLACSPIAGLFTCLSVSQPVCSSVSLFANQSSCLLICLPVRLSVIQLAHLSACLLIIQRVTPSVRLFALPSSARLFALLSASSLICQPVWPIVSLFADLSAYLLVDHPVRPSVILFAQLSSCSNSRQAASRSVSHLQWERGGRRREGQRSAWLSSSSVRVPSGTDLSFTVWPTHFKIFRPDQPKNSPAVEKIRPRCNDIKNIWCKK